MTDPGPPPKADKNPEVFLEQVNKVIKKINTEIGRYLEDMANFINDHLTEIGALIGAGSGGVVGGVVGGFAGHALEGRFDDYCDRVQEAWENTQKQIGTGIGLILGNPMKMTSIASAYRDAVSPSGSRLGLSEVKGKVMKADRYVENFWEGVAYVAYSNTSTAQKDALSGMIRMLGDAADLLDDNCVALLRFWNDQLKNIWDLYVKVLQEGVGMVEIENALTGGTKGLIKLITKVGEQVGTIVHRTNDYWLELNVKSAGDWDSLQTKFEDRGLPNRQWPDIDSLDKDNINSSWTSKG